MNSIKHLPHLAVVYILFIHVYYHYIVFFLYRSEFGKCTDVPDTLRGEVDHMNSFTPCSRHCLNCYELIHIIKPVNEIKCPFCGQLHRVIQTNSTKLSKLSQGLSQKPTMGKTTVIPSVVSNHEYFEDLGDFEMIRKLFARGAKWP